MFARREKVPALFFGYAVVAPLSVQGNKPGNFSVVVPSSVQENKPGTFSE
jgi:hypothetical protein